MTERLPKLIEGIGCCSSVIERVFFILFSFRQRHGGIATQAEATIRGELTTLPLCSWRFWSRNCRPFHQAL